MLKKIVEEVKSETRSSVTADMLGKNVKDILAKEATTQLELKQNLQITATQAKTLDTIKAEMGIPLDSPDVVCGIDRLWCLWIATRCCDQADG